jgi:hypothetical protein
MPRRWPQQGWRCLWGFNDFIDDLDEFNGNGLDFDEFLRTLRVIDDSEDFDEFDDEFVEHIDNQRW